MSVETGLRPPRAERRWGARVHEIAPRPSHVPAARPDDAGWRVVVGAFLVTLVGYGAIYSFGAFAEEIGTAFGSSRASVSLIYVLSGGSCFLISAVSGRLADRVGGRALAAAGMVMVGLGLIVAATAGSMIEVYAGYGLLIGLGTGFAYVPAVAAVQRCFTAHRGLASGIAVSGVGVGTALVPPGAEALSMLGDWRMVFLACGVLAILVGLFGAALLPPAAEEGEAPAPRSGPPDGPGFALAWAGTLMVSVPLTLPYAGLVSTARDLGFGRGEAVALLSLVGLGSIAGRFALAALADAVGRRAVFLGCCAGVAGSMAIWALAGDLGWLQAFALAFGALQGGFVALLPAFVADSFGARALGATIGLLYTSRGVALLAGPPALAFGITLLAGHALPLLAAALVGGVGTLLLAAVRR